ncbi:PAS domain S-box protein, partial [Allocoleopsis sp.]|uniref:PAS domain-containing protein n=1 Tax=Allocoleopsis sp. TaxID=3088169 RepID=UPI002FD51460
MLDQHLEVMSDRETLLQNVFDTVSTGLFVIEVEGLDDSTTENTTFRFVMTNPAYDKLLSIPNNSLAGLWPHEALPSEVADRFSRNYNRCLEQRQPISYEESVESEADHRTLLTTLSPIFAADGQISRIIGSSQDVTAYTQVETASKPVQQDTTVKPQLAPPQLTNELLPVNTGDRQWIEDFLWLTHLSLEQSAIMACLVEQEARFIYVNDAACQLLGYSRQELLSMSVGDVTPDFPPEAWPEHWQEVKQRRSFTFEAVKQRKDNQRFPVEITVNYFEFNGGEYNFVLVRNITNRQQTEEALSQEKEL